MKQPFGDVCVCEREREITVESVIRKRTVNTVVLCFKID